MTIEGDHAFGVESGIFEQSHPALLAEINRVVTGRCLLLVQQSQLLVQSGGQLRAEKCFFLILGTFLEGGREHE